MHDSAAESLEKMKKLKSALIKETEKIEEILRLIDVSWNDPGAEMIKKNLAVFLNVLDEQALILQNNTRNSREKGIRTDQGIWEEKEEQKPADLI